MEQTPFALTPKQQRTLTALSRETGKPVPALLDEALEALQARAPRASSNGHESMARAPSAPAWTEQKNQRRCHLVDKDIDGTISLVEKAELDQLQADMLAYRRHIAPLPLDDLRRAGSAPSTRPTITASQSARSTAAGVISTVALPPSCQPFWQS